MKDWSIIAIVLGVLGALVGVYLRESVRRAHQQKIIATKLEAYLMSWNRHILEGPFKDIFLIGYVWSEDETKEFQAKGAEGLKDVKEKYADKFKALKNAIEKGDDDIRRNAEEYHGQIRVLSNEQFNVLLKHIDQAKQNLVRSYSFISDDEAAVLSWFCSQHVIPLKSAMLAMLNYSEQLLATLRSLTTFNMLAISDSSYKMIESSIYMAKHYMPLLRHAQEIRNRNLLKLTLRNLVQ